MKLSEFENEKALDLIADIIEPISEISTDTEFVSHIRNGEKLSAVKVLLKNHKKSVLYILAILNNEEPNKYKANILTMTKSVLELLNDEDLMTVFQMQG